MESITVNLEAKEKLLYKAVMITIHVFAYLRLINIETAAKIIKWMSSKGLLIKYRIDKGKWRNMKTKIDYELYDGE